MIVGLLLPQFLGLIIGLLQLSQLKPHITNASFMMFLIGKVGLESIPEMSNLWQSIGFADLDLMLRQKA